MRIDITPEGRNRFRVRTPYAPALVDRFRAMPGREYHPDDRAWSFPAAPDVLLMVCDACGVMTQDLPPALRALCKGVEPRKPPPPDPSLAAGHDFLTEPYGHQREGFCRLLQDPRWLLAWEPGVGKTHPVVNRLKVLLAREPGARVLVACPKSVMAVWEDQLKEHGGMGCALFEGTARAKDRVVNGGQSVTVVNYENLFRHLGVWDRRAWDALVLDEIHRCKNFTSQTSRAARKLSRAARHVWGLSGTPTPNGLEDWFGVLSTIDPGLLPARNKADFEGRYCVKARVGGDGPWKVAGYRNVHELHGHVLSRAERLTREECLDLPGKVVSDRVVRLAGAQQKAYKDLRTKAVARLEGLKASGTLTVANVLTESLRLLQVVGGFVPDDQGAMHQLGTPGDGTMAKVGALADVLRDAGGRQAVVWCAFVEEAKFLQRWLQDNYGVAALLTGQTNTAGRRQAVEDFRAGRARYFVGTSAGGEGINGLQVADTEVFYSRNWNLKDYVQQADRLDRIGQRNVVNVVHLVARGTVDERVDLALRKKSDLQEMLLRDPGELF